MKRFDKFIDDLSRLISFKSVQGEPCEGAPFGKEVSGALDCFLSIAEDMGFTVKNHGGYIGEITLGEGEEIGIIGHLDVVPVGLGWETEPFTLTEKSGVYYGRGVLDDKGPTLLALYALNELKNSDEKINKKFRLFVGTNEESGWKDIAYFNSVQNFPEYGFSPDGNFPLTYAEKGILEVEFRLPAPKNFYAMNGGTALNAVCDYASCLAKEGFINPELAKSNGLLVNGDKIESFGKSAHGSTPHLGKNALLPLFSYLTDMGEDYKKVIDCLFSDVYGLTKTLTPQGKLTLSPNLLKEEGGEIFITCDCRIPYPLTIKEVTEKLSAFNIPFKTKERHPPTCAEKEGFLVKTLINAYNFVMKSNAEPVAMGGSTFARAFRYGCSFGPDNADGKCGNIHDANEFITKEHILTCYEIYKKAIFDLAK